MEKCKTNQKKKKKKKEANKRKQNNRRFETASRSLVSPAFVRFVWRLCADRVLCLKRSRIVFRFGFSPPSSPGGRENLPGCGTRKSFRSPRSLPGMIKVKQRRCCRLGVPENGNERRANGDGGPRRRFVSE